MKKRKPKQPPPCHFCRKPTRRKVKFGACTFSVPCCGRCEYR